MVADRGAEAAGMVDVEDASLAYGRRSPLLSDVNIFFRRLKKEGVSTGVPKGDLVGDGLCLAFVPKEAGGAVAPTAPGLVGGTSVAVVPVGVEGPWDAFGLVALSPPPPPPLDDDLEPVK